MSQSLLGPVIAQNKSAAKTEDVAFKKIAKSDEEWKRILSPDQYYITRQAGTEAPYSSPLLNVHDAGVFECVCCDLPLFSSKEGIRIEHGLAELLGSNRPTERTGEN